MERSQVIDNIRQVAASVLPKGSTLYLYGSRARGDDHEDSDWDLLLLLNNQGDSDETFRQYAYPIIVRGYDLWQSFSVHTYSKDEWYNGPHPLFYYNVEHDKQLIYESQQEERDIMVALEMEKADSTFAEHEGLTKNGYWSNLANRLYYALFHAVSAMLIFDGREVGSHKGAAIRFHQYYVRTGIFTIDEGSFYQQMQTLREKADYNCYFKVSEAEVTARIEPTRSLIEKIKKYIAEKQAQ